MLREPLPALAAGLNLHGLDPAGRSDFAGQPLKLLLLKHGRSIAIVRHHFLRAKKRPPGMGRQGLE
jgi:hypothetical protein